MSRNAFTAGSGLIIIAIKITLQATPVKIEGKESILFSLCLCVTDLQATGRRGRGWSTVNFVHPTSREHKLLYVCYGWICNPAITIQQKLFPADGSIKSKSELLRTCAARVSYLSLQTHQLETEHLLGCNCLLAYTLYIGPEC